MFREYHMTDVEKAIIALSNRQVVMSKMIISMADTNARKQTLLPLAKEFLALPTPFGESNVPSQNAKRATTH
jgi:hypothetical protein